MIAFGNRWKRNLGKTITEFLAGPQWVANGVSLAAARVRMEEEYNEDGTGKRWYYYSAGGGIMRLYATTKMAQSRYPKGEVFQVEVPDE